MDIWSPKKRSEVMSRIRSKNTGPERTLRSLLYSMGYRFRLHAKDLPGKPDIVFRQRSAAIFVHGCFWHLHAGCRDGTIPKSNRNHWRTKLQRNVSRDRQHVRKLRRMGWGVLTVWECEIEKMEERLTRKMKVFLSGRHVIRAKFAPSARKE